MNFLAYLGFITQKKRVEERMRAQEDNDRVAEAYRRLDDSLVALRDTISEVKAKGLTDQRQNRDSGDTENGR